MANATCIKGGKKVFSHGLHNLSAFAEGAYAIAANSEVLERVGVVKKTAAALLAVWNIAKIDVAGQGDEL